MSEYKISPEADEDLFGIWSYLAREAGLAIANRIESELYEKFQSLAQMPGQGHSRTDLPVLFFPVYQFLIVYRKKTPLEIVAVLRGKRNVKDVLRQRL